MYAVIHERDGTYIVKKLTIGVGAEGIVMTGTEEECNNRLSYILNDDREFYLVSRVNLEKMVAEREIVHAPRGSNLCFPDAIFALHFLDKEEAYNKKRSLEYLEEMLKIKPRGCV